MIDFIDYEVTQWIDVNKDDDGDDGDDDNDNDDDGIDDVDDGYEDGWLIMTVSARIAICSCDWLKMNLDWGEDKIWQLFNGKRWDMATISKITISNWNWKVQVWRLSVMDWIWNSSLKSVHRLQQCNMTSTLIQRKRKTSIHKI